MTTNQNRADGRTANRYGHINRPGTFGTKPLTRADAGILGTRIDPREGMNIELGPRNPDSPIQTARLRFEDRAWVLEADQMVDIEWFAPDDVGDKHAWAMKHRHAIDWFLRDRYDIDPDRTPEDTVYDYTASLEDLSATMTEERALQRLWDETNLVQLWNEIDSGTDGEETLERLVAEHLETVVVTDTWGAAAADVPWGDIDAAVDNGKIDDRIAGAIAKSIDDAARINWSGKFYRYASDIRDLYRKGYVDRVTLISSIDKLLDTQEGEDEHGDWLRALRRWAER
ncbi:hypothetical protein [Agromyces humi]|uniref:hypothetical protein n=1 Tax=Agromyces humi TaxID=1766800 RepID=UPI001357E409|nr:hypothetical protein [Agromyces humi]